MCVRVARSIFTYRFGFLTCNRAKFWTSRVGGKGGLCMRVKKRLKCEVTQVNPIQEVLESYLVSLSFHCLSAAICHCLSLATVIYSLWCLSPGGEREKIRVKIEEIKCFNLTRACLAEPECGKGTLVFFLPTQFSKEMRWQRCLTSHEANSIESVMPMANNQTHYIWQGFREIK